MNSQSSSDCHSLLIIHRFLKEIVLIVLFVISELFVYSKGIEESKAIHKEFYIMILFEYIHVSIMISIE